MKSVLTALVLFLPTYALADCPPLPERSAHHKELMEQVANAPDEITALTLTNELWEIWATAPNETAQAILQRGMERRAAGDYAGAINDFNTLIDYCPHYAEGYNQRGFVKFILRDYDDALADLDAVISRMPDHIAARTGRALTLMQLGRRTEAQIALRAAVALNPWLPERNRLEPLDDSKSSSKTEL